MIAIGIVGILAAVAVPNFKGWMHNARLKSAARDLVSNFQRTRMEAVKRNTNVVISFTPGTYQEAGQVGSYQVFVDNGADGGTANNGIRDGTEPILIQTTMPRNVSLYDTNFGENTTGYNSQGLSRGNGTVKLRNNNSVYYKAVFSSAGHIRLEKSTDGENWN